MPDDDESGLETTVLRDGTVEWSIHGLQVRVSPEEALQLVTHTLARLGWIQEHQLGLKVGDLVSGMPDERTRTDQMERLRAGGRHVDVARVQRSILAAAWTSNAPAPAPVRRTRSFVKEIATSAPDSVPARKGGKRAKAGGVVPAGTQAPWVLPENLFTDPLEQLRYEIRHSYLCTVPTSQRQEWPLGEYDVLPSFLNDLDYARQRISRQQVIACAVDVISGRALSVRSRNVHPLRLGDGLKAHTDQAIMTRSDGAVAYRAYVTAGTPAAMRIMWWRTRAGGLELTRLANHDDMAMPER